MHASPRSWSGAVPLRDVLRWPVVCCSLPFFTLSFLLPIYAKRLGASAASIGELYAIVAVVMIVTRPLIGWAMDRFGRKRFFVSGLMCYIAALALFAMARDMETLFVARMIQGVGGALAWITAYTMATELALPDQRGEAVGRIDSASHRGSLYGILAALFLMSWLPSQVAWSVVFSVYAVMAGLAVVIAWRYVPETRPVSVCQEHHPLHITWPLIRLLVIVFVASGSSALTRPLLLIYVQDRFAADLGYLALAFLPTGLVFGFLPAYLGRLSDRIGRIPLMVCGLIGSGIMSLVLPYASHLGWFIVACTGKAVGIVMASPAQKALLGDLTGSEERGTGYGLYAFASSLGAAIAPPLGGWLYDAVDRGAPFYANGMLLLMGAGWVVLCFGNHTFQQADTRPRSSVR